MQPCAVVGVELAVGHAPARAHQLDLSGMENALIAEAVAMLQGAGKHVAENLHVAMGMGAEAPTGGDAVFVDDPEGTETHVRGIVVIGEGEAVGGVEPAVVGMTSFMGGAFPGKGRWMGHVLGCAALRTMANASSL